MGKGTNGFVGVLVVGSGFDVSILVGIWMKDGAECLLLSLCENAMGTSWVAS